MRFQILTLATAALSVTSALARAVAAPPLTGLIPASTYPPEEFEQQVDKLSAAAGVALASVQQLRTGNNINLIGPSIIDGFRALVHAITDQALVLGLLQQINLRPESQGKVCRSYKQLVDLNSQIVQAFFDQANITTGTRFQGPLNAMLRVFEGAVTNYDAYFIRQVPSCAAEVKTETAKLMVMIRLAILDI